MVPGAKTRTRPTRCRRHRRVEHCREHHGPMASPCRPEHSRQATERAHARRFAWIERVKHGVGERARTRRGVEAEGGREGEGSDAFVFCSLLKVPAGPQARALLVPRVFAFSFHFRQFSGFPSGRPRAGPSVIFACSLVP